MDGEQVGTAPTDAGGPEGAPQGAATEAQPEQAAKVESQPVQVNWDDPNNPWRAKYEGFQGNFKQVKGEADQAKVRLQQLEYERQQWQAEREQATRTAEQARLQQLIDGDPVDLQAELKSRMAAETARQEWEQVTIPRVQQQAYQQVYQQYQQGLVEAMVEAGLPEDEIRTVARETGNDFKQFMKGMVGKVGERAKPKEAGPEISSLQEELKAAREQLKAFQRAGETSPDATPGSPVSSDDDDNFIRQFGVVGGRNRSRTDVARAAKILGLY